MKIWRSPCCRTGKEWEWKAKGRRPRPRELHKLGSELSSHHSGQNTHPWAATTSSSAQVVPNAMTLAQYMAAKNGQKEKLNSLLVDVKDPHLKLLHVAAEEGHLDVVMDLAQQFPEKLNEKDELYRTALHVATRKGRYAVVQWLMTCPDVERDCKDGYHRTPLHIAAIRGDSDEDGRMVMELLKGRFVESKDMAGRTPLHYAALKGHVLVAKTLTQGRVPIANHNAKDNLGYTPLHLAAYNRKALSVFQLLLEMPMTSWDAKNNDGLTPLHFAAQVGNVEAVSLLQRRYRTAASSTSAVWLQTPLQIAAIAGYVQVIQVIRNCVEHDSLYLTDLAGWSDAIGRTALHYAAMYGQAAVVEELLNWGSPMQSVLEGNDYGGFTALHLAAREGHYEVVRHLIAASAHVNVKAGRSIIAPDLRSWALSKTVEQVILKSSDFQPSEGMSALHFAARGGHMLVVKELFILKQRLETSALDNNGLTPLDWARISGSLDQYLAYAGDEVIPKNSDSQPELSSSRLKYLQDALEVENKEALAYQSHVHKNKVDFETRLSVPRDEDGVSIIHGAASRGDEDLISQLLCLPQINVNEQDIAGNTPAHLAARYGHAGALKVLLSHPGIAPNIKNHWKGTPFRLAFLGNHVEACRMILGLVNMEVEENLGMLLRDAIRKDWFEMSALLVSQKSTGAMDQGRTDGKSALDLAKDKGNRYVELLLRRKDVRRRLLEGRQSFMETGDAILIASTLIASITYQGWLQPPQSHQETALRCFWWLNSFSFYLAIAAVLAGAVGALPTPRTEFMDSVFKARRAVTVACILLATATMSVMGAFGAAGLAVIWNYNVAILFPLVAGSMLCISILLWFASRLLRLHCMATLWDIVSRDTDQEPPTTAHLLDFTPVCSGVILAQTAEAFECEDFYNNL